MVSCCGSTPPPGQGMFGRKGGVACTYGPEALALALVAACPFDDQTNHANGGTGSARVYVSFR
jgi:hypothetical protein